MLTHGANHRGAAAVPAIRVGAGGHRPRRTFQLALIRPSDHARGMATADPSPLRIFEHVCEQPGTWVTVLTGDMGYTFLVLFSHVAAAAVVGPVGPVGNAFSRWPQVP